MIYRTERQRAEKEFNSIKLSLQSSLLNYRIHSESPFGAVFEVKILFVKDYSPTLDESPNLTSSPVQYVRFHEDTMENDSGLNNISTQDNSYQLETVQSELVKTLIEVGELKNDINTKDLIIKKLSSKINSLEDLNKNIKTEITSKNEQLKHKNKTVENLKTKNDDIIKKNEKEMNVQLNEVKNSMRSRLALENKVDEF